MNVAGEDGKVVGFVAVQDFSPKLERWAPKLERWAASKDNSLLHFTRHNRLDHVVDDAYGAMAPSDAHDPPESAEPHTLTWEGQNPALAESRTTYVRLTERRLHLLAT